MLTVTVKNLNESQSNFENLSNKFKLSDDLSVFLRKKYPELTNGQAELIAVNAIQFSGDLNFKHCALLANRLVSIVRTFEGLGILGDSNGFLV